LRRRRARPARKASRRLILEALEDRVLLSYRFTDIADTAGPYSDLSAFSRRPALNNDGTVAFWAALKSGGEAIFTSDAAGSLTTMATTGGLVSAFDSGPSINSEGTVAFRAKLAAGGKAIFKTDGGELTRIADTNQVFQSFLGLSAIIGDSGKVTFLAS